MSIKNVKQYFQKWQREKDIIEFEQPTATVAQAALALNVIEARIAKSISLKNGGLAMIVVSAGDTKLDNKKFKAYFGFKASMLTPDEALCATGHAVGGVCPFALPPGVLVYLDVSLKRFETIFPACGSSNSAIELTPDELHEYSNNKEWIDVCKQVE
ncbi:proline--tRNA ligase [Spirochaetia bacterium]|nr:proline--tRNA ligase [Spirochaetia bacterium]